MTSPLTSNNMKQDATYPLHDQAKILNNRAAYQVTNGNHQEGINLLTIALKLNDRSRSSEADHMLCSCHLSSLQSCRMLEKDNERQHYQHATTDDYPYSTRQFRKEDSCKHPNRSYNGNKRQPIGTGNDDDDDNAGFVYRRLLLVHDDNIYENHYMGSTLSLIILFNLALTHHLLSIDNVTNNIDCDLLDIRYKSLKTALKLYELAHQLHIDIIDDQQKLRLLSNMMVDTNTTNDNHNNADDNDAVVSLHLTMIITNNLGQIHRVAGNTGRYEMCLQHLLGLIMYNIQQQQFSSSRSSSSSSFNTLLDSTEFNGFIRNLSSILSTDICASAA